MFNGILNSKSCGVPHNFVSQAPERSPLGRKPARTALQILGTRDPKRGLNIQLSIRAQEPWPPAPALRNLLLRGDPQITAEKLRALTFVAPRKEDPNEYQLIAEYFAAGGEFEALHPAEQIVVVLGSLPDCEGFLNALLFVRSFEALYEATLEAAECVLAACRDIQSSPLLKHVLRVILRLGYVRFCTTTARSDSKAVCSERGWTASGIQFRLS